MADEDLFKAEAEVIAKAWRTLRRKEAAAGPSARDYQWLLDQYLRLYKQSRRVIRFSDRMQRAISREVTALKQAEAEKEKLTENLRSTSMLLNTILDAIPDVIGVQDPDHGILRYNKAGYHFFGLSPHEVHGRKCSSLIGGGIPSHDCPTVEVYRTGKPCRVEEYSEETDRWFDVRAYPVLDENGKIAQVVEHLRDISTEKKAESRLREAHERLLTILNSIDAHIYVADIDTFKILFMNKKMVDDFKGDFTGRKCYESFQNGTKPCVRCTNKSLLDQNRNPRDVHTWQGKNPVNQHWYLNFDRAIKWVDGRIVKIRIATDITEDKRIEEERRKMQKQLQEAQKFEAIATLAAGVAHDFNNLLMGIQGRVSLLALNLEPHHPHCEHTSAIMDYIQSATDLTKQLLGLAHGGKYEARPTDINRVVEKSAAMFGRTRKEIRIHKQLQASRPVVTADRGQIEQVFLNLFLNAWQAMPSGGDLYLETATVPIDNAFCKTYQLKPGSYVRISVRDTGCGMDKATRDRIFDPFFTTKEKGRGTGLGLASAYGIIKNHAGTITVRSRVGRGTRFNIYFPLSDRAALPEPPSELGLRHGHETILLIDDEEMIRQVGQAMLEALGYQVIAIDSGEHAVDLLRRNGPEIDLVILDLIMPGMGGGKTFDQIRRLLPQMPVLLSSGYSRDDKVNSILQRGCNGFIQKPFHLSELSRKIRDIIDGKIVISTESVEGFGAGDGTPLTAPRPQERHG